MSEVRNIIQGGGGAAPTLLMPVIEPPTRTRILFQVGATYVTLFNELPAGQKAFNLWAGNILEVLDNVLASKAWYAYRFPAGAVGVSWLVEYESKEKLDPPEPSQDAPGMDGEEGPQPEEEKKREWWIFKW